MRAEHDRLKTEVARLVREALREYFARRQLSTATIGPSQGQSDAASVVPAAATSRRMSMRRSSRISTNSFQSVVMM